MIIKKYTDFSGFQANMYVIGSKNNAIIIDPCVPYEKIKADWEGYTWEYIILTHGHFDHFSFLNQYLKHLPCKVLLHKQALVKLKNPTMNFSHTIAKATSIDLMSEQYELAYEGLKKTFGKEELRIMETPGHSDCSISIMINDAIFTGDVIFQNSVGRCDLITGNHAILKESLRRFYHLKKEYQLYPGHDEQTNLSIEKKQNPYLKVFL